jgi:hypothetical protein
VLFSALAGRRYGTGYSTPLRLLTLLHRKPKLKYDPPVADGKLPWPRPTSPVKLFRKSIPRLREKHKPRTATAQVPPKTKRVKVNKRKNVDKKVVCDYIPWTTRQSVFLGPRVPSHYELRDGENGEIEWIPPKPTRPPPPVPETPRLVELAEEPVYIPPMPKKKKKTRKDGEVREKKSKKHDRSRLKKENLEKGGEVREKKSRKHDRSWSRKDKSDYRPLIKSKSEDFLLHPRYYNPFPPEDQTFDISIPVPIPRKKKEKKEEKDCASRPKKRKNEKAPRLQELNEDGTHRERKTKTANRPRKKRTKNSDYALVKQIKSSDLATLDRERYIKDHGPYRNTESQSLEKKPRTAETSHERIENVYPPRPIRTNPDGTFRKRITKTADQPREKTTEETELARKKKLEVIELARKKEAYAEVLRRGNYITYAYNPFRLSPRKTKNAPLTHTEAKQKDTVSPTKKSKNDPALRAMRSIRDLFSREKKDEQDDGARQQKPEKEVTSHIDKINRNTSLRKRKKRNVQFGGNKRVKDAAYHAKKRADAVRLIEHIENKLAHPVESAYPLDQAYATMEASSRKNTPQVRNPFERKRSAPVSETRKRRPSLRKDTFSSLVLLTRQPTISERRGARPPARLGHRRPTLNSSVTAPAVPTATPTKKEPSSMRETLRRRPTLGDLLASIYNSSVLNLSPPDETTPPVPRIPLSFTSAAISMAAPSIVCKCCTSLSE